MNRDMENLRETESPAANEPERWFLVLTKPAGETTACENLKRQGYRVYHPRALQPSNCRRRAAQRVVALFPRYIFVRADSANRNLAPIRSTLGIVGIVRFGSEPAVVSKKVIEDLIQRADPQTGLHSLNLPSLEPGAEVQVIGGVFAGLDGVFQRSAGDERIVVLLKLLGQETQVKLSTELVCPRAAA